MRLPEVEITKKSLFGFACWSCCVYLFQLLTVF